ncbi:hypothetical protein EAN04_24640 [Salmonella enterica]|nr:hypothetical protein [Salmonella enterica]
MLDHSRTTIERLTVQLDLALPEGLEARYWLTRHSNRSIIVLPTSWRRQERITPLLSAFIMPGGKVTSQTRAGSNITELNHVALLAQEPLLEPAKGDHSPFGIAGTTRVAGEVLLPSGEPLEVRYFHSRRERPLIHLYHRSWADAHHNSRIMPLVQVQLEAHSRSVTVYPGSLIGGAALADEAVEVYQSTAHYLAG